MSKFPVKPDVVIEFIKDISEKLTQELVEKILSITPNDEVNYIYIYLK